MKSKRKVTKRERWVLAIAPALLIGGVYYFGYFDDLNNGLEKESKRAAAAVAPLPPPVASPALVQAKAALNDAKRAVADRTASVEELDAKKASLPANIAVLADSRKEVHEIERVEAVFARNGITPVVSEAVGDGDSGDQALLAVLSPKFEGEAAGGKQFPRVWHCIFDDSTLRFQRALAEVASEVPAVIPLTFNLVYNPANSGETRLLELWLLY